ncbi:TPA: hypothetical protein I8Y04_001990 [Raoultella planticola]|nr:hypothetical protein [Raoultella planticola]
MPVKIVAERSDAEQEAVLIRKGEAERRQASDAALAAIRADDTWRRIFSRYFAAEVPK